MKNFLTSLLDTRPEIIYKAFWTTIKVTIGLCLFLFSICIALAYIFDIKTKSDYLALSQVVTEISLIPFIVFGFLLAITEFRNMQKGADFCLFVNRELYEIHGSHTHLLIHDVHLQNIGYEMATECYIRLFNPPDMKLQPLSGDSNWYINSIKLDNEKTVDIVDYTYMRSDKNPSIYPGYKKLTGSLIIIPEKNWVNGKSEIFIPYEIFSDNSPKKQGKLLINIRVENKREN